MFIDMGLVEYLEKTKSKDMPGGGSVVGYTGALGAALTMMVANLTYGKKSFESLDESIKDEVKKDYDKMDALIEELKKMVDEDAKSFDGVLDAYKLPKETDEEKAFRKQKIQEGYKVAMDVPLRTCELILECMRNQRSFAKYGNIYAITDQGAGTLLLAASGEAVLLNVIINLNSIDEGPYKEEVKEKLAKYTKEIKELKEELMDSCYGRLEIMK
ncbi:cyclodeaminase/cyclohydrolase family protein [Miniphocaeibacter halophilus]|uniref:Cyclodeaminase/cyclohydrolase family protein n=1 Tax=Miniphocaeibacter halophilus TaxID=2931922 RepID=A0AC61MSU6_9FIRM|nr:cyclodeaminase/cyclohydrolase family protein [Miniphocaeibacter halophilus]QQK08769.1 cyclodeaminase/cyclohydrolase family protein [Miniphocaeibacter halophilus]